MINEPVVMSMVDDMLDQLIGFQRTTPLTIPALATCFLDADTQRAYLATMLATAIGRLA
jgi:hypothetical protein